MNGASRHLPQDTRRRTNPPPSCRHSLRSKVREGAAARSTTGFDVPNSDARNIHDLTPFVFTTKRKARTPQQHQNFERSRGWHVRARAQVEDLKTLRSLHLLRPPKSVQKKTAVYSTSAGSRDYTSTQAKIFPTGQPDGRNISLLQQSHVSSLPTRTPWLYATTALHGVYTRGNQQPWNAQEQ